MLNYIKSKLFYAKLKMEIYKALSHSDDYIEMLTKLAIASKEMTPDDVKKEFLAELASVIHDSVHKDDGNDKKERE
ncbi:hypothetical protein DS742_13920 [Lacrimispora amygdalina]|uniref:Uncharacterized protein n=1 Tax=Lacrimispora amygdalina TaxID=253257 RepID=A0A3E2NBF4_9FIRM|nr:hypothetical protein [Clostridium indicum]RFZ78211.1 hypothetical protein DS742_13920 [Clostridium indicum]